MANARHRNTIFIDSTGTITVDALIPVVYGVLITPSDIDSVVQISCESVTKIDIYLETPDSKYMVLAGWEGSGIELAASFDVDTLTNITSVILVGRFSKAVGRGRE